MNLSGLASGLSAVYPGMVQGDTAATELDQKKAQLQQLLTLMGGQQARGNALGSMFGGGPNGAMAMPPGQNSMPPAPPASFMGQGGAPSAGAMPPGGQMGRFAQGPGLPGGMQPGPGTGGPPGPPQGQGGPGQQPLDWRMIIRSVQQQNPGLPPEQLAAAVDQFMPMMSMQSRLEWQQMSMQLRAQMHEQTIDSRLDAATMRRPGAGAAPSGDTGGGGTAPGAAPGALQQPGGFMPVQMRFTENGIGVPTARSRQPSIPRAGFTERQRIEVIDDLRQSLGREPTLDEIARRSNELKTLGKAPTRAQMQLENEQRQYQQVDTTLSDAIGDIRKGYARGASVTGLMGRGSTIAEIVGNIAGVDQTLANEFAQKIYILRAQVPKLLSGRAQISKDERANIERIIPGLGAGSTQQITFKDLEYLQKILRLRAPKGAFEDSSPPPAPVAAPKPGGEPDSGAQLKPMTPEAEALRKKALDAGHSSADVEKKLRDLGYDPAGAAKPELEPADGRQP